MKHFTTLVAMALISGSAYSQPVLVSGFNGMAAVNGTAYAKTGTVGDPTGGYAFVAASNDRSLFFASSFSKHHLYFIDPSSYAITDSINFDFYQLTAFNENNTLFARINSGICRVNTASKTITDSVAIPDAFAVSERPNSKEVWVGVKNTIVVVNYTSGLVAAAPFAYSGNANDDGDIRFTKGGSTAYKVAWNSNKIYKINAATKTILDSAVLSSSPMSVLVSNDSSRLFVTFPNDKKIRIYQTSTMAIADSIDCGTREPFEIFMHPDRAEVWVVNHFKDSVTVYNEATNAQIAAFGVSSSPHYVAFGAGTSGVGNTSATGRQVAAYPNPVTDNVTLTNIQTGDNIEVYDIAGRHVFSIKATGATQTFNISALRSGNYMIRITDDRGQDKALTHITKL